MEKLIVEELCKNLKWYERIIIKRHKRLICKIYDTVRFKLFNKMTE